MYYWIRTYYDQVFILLEFGAFDDHLQSLNGHEFDYSAVFKGCPIQQYEKAGFVQALPSVFGLWIILHKKMLQKSVIILKPRRLLACPLVPRFAPLQRSGLLLQVVC